EAEVVDAGIVRDAGEILDAGIAQGGDQGFGDAAKAESADGDHLAVGDDVGQCAGGVREDLAHGKPRWQGRVAMKDYKHRPDKHRPGGDGPAGPRLAPFPQGPKSPLYTI